MRRFRTFFKYFTKNKKAFLKYSGLSFIAGILELFGVALTYPFIIKLLAKEPQAGFFNSPLIIGLSIITLFLVKNALMIFYTYLQAKFTKNIEAELNLSFMKYFLSSSYQESSKVSLAQKENILGFLIPNVINNYILRLLNLNVNFFIFGLITLFLVIKFPIATVITMIFAFVIISLQNLIFKPRLLKIANSQSNASAMYNQRANEAILNIKSVKVSNNEKFFYENYKTAIFNFFKISRQALFFNTIPPYVTEPFIIILLFVLLSVITIENFSEPEKLVASFAVIVSAIFRLSPTIARIQVNLNGINSVLSMVDEFLALCKKFDIQNVKPLKTPDYYQLQDKIELKNVSFKYKDEIAQGGSNVSGGQKQRISIARALAKNPEIYVFDDSFSALDLKTDAALREALSKKTHDKTVIIVAQRISTILDANQIIVLEEGKVVGIGTHEELMNNNETYRQIALSQLSEEELKKKGGE